MTTHKTVDVTTIYRLHIAPDEYGAEGEDLDEWFSSLKVAKARREELIAMDPDLENHRTGSDYQIEKVKLRRMPKVLMMLRLLNRRDYSESRETVVEA